MYAFYSLFQLPLEDIDLEAEHSGLIALLQVFERALKYNEPEKVYLEMAKIYENSEKQELASKTFETMARRFHTSPAVWTAYAAFKFRQVCDW